MHVFLALIVWVAQDAEIERLIQALGSDEARDRERAERRLVELGVKARPAVIRASTDGNAEIAARAREVLRSTAFRMEDLYDAGFRRETARAIPEFPRKLWSPDPAERLALLRELVSRKDPKDLDAVAKVLETEDLHESIRLACLDLVESGEVPQLAPLIVALLQSPNVPDRGRVLRALATAKSKSAAPFIVPLLEAAQWTSQAADALERLEVALTEPQLRSMLRSRERTVKGVAVTFVLKNGLKGFNAELADILQHRSIDMIWEAWEALARSRPSWTEVQPMLSSSQKETRLYGLRLAVEARMPQAFDAALALLDEEPVDGCPWPIDVVVAWGGADIARRLSEKGGPGALIALGRLGAPGARERAVKALESGNVAMRRAGITAIRALDAHDLADAVRARLEDPDPGVRAQAAQVLPHLGGDASGAFLAARLATEEDPQVLERLLDGIAETAHAAAAPQVLRILQGGKSVYPLGAAVRAAGALRIQEAAPLLVQGYVTGKPEGCGGAYEALLQIRPDNLVDLLRPLVKKPKKDDDDDGPLVKRVVDRGQEGRNERALYLLYVDPPGAKQFFLQCLKEDILPRYPLEEIRFHGVAEAIPWVVDHFDRGNMDHMSGVGRFLASYGCRDLLDKAVGWLTTRDPGPAYELFSGLQPQDKIPEIAALLQRPDKDVQQKALNALVCIGGPKVEEILWKRFDDESSPMDRAIAARMVTGRDRELIPKVEELLDHEDPAVRVEAAYTLHLMNSRGSYDRLLKAYRRGIGKEDWVWPYAFAKLGGAEGRAMLRPTFEASSNKEQRQNLLRAMSDGTGHTEDEIAFVERYLDDRDLQAEAWDSFMNMAPARACRLLSNPRYRMGRVHGRFSFHGLEQPKASEAVPALISILRDREYGYRGQAAAILGKLGAREAVEPLARAIHDEHAYVRSSAAAALCRLGDRRGVDEILRMPRHTTVAQGRMDSVLYALNYARNPEASRSLESVRWEWQGPSTLTLQQALEELARRSGRTLTISKAVSAEGLRRPLDWPNGQFSSEEIAVQRSWSRFAAMILEPEEIRVLTPDEAFAFWEEWARTR